MAALTAGVMLSGENGAAAPPRAPDFNWDQLDDLVVGTPLETVAGDYNAGTMNFLYGDQSDGLSKPGGHTFGLNQETANVLEQADASDDFGGTFAAAEGPNSAGIAWGDFDGDCYDDVVTGVPGEEVGSDDAAGVIHVFYSGASGPSTVDELWSRDSGTLVESADANDYFGHAMAAGDFDGDGYDDVVVGVPYDNLGATDAGSVHVIYGSNSGLTDDDDAAFGQATADIDGTAETGDHFGAVVAAGDFNCDGYDDVAIGIPGENSDAGAVQIIYGSNAGLSATAGPGNDVFAQGEGNIAETAEAGDHFGAVLAVGNFDDNSSGGIGCMDLAVGVPDEDSGTGLTQDGIVHVFYGASASGLQFTSPDDDVWHQDTGNIEGARETGDLFGWALAVGEVDNDAYDDLIIGVPQEESSGEPSEHGAVAIIRGGSGGLVDTSDVLWHQETTGIPQDNESADLFGYAVAFGQKYDFNDAIGGLVVSAPTKDWEGTGQAGLMFVIYLSDASTPTIASAETWDQIDIDASEDHETFGYFGSALFPTRSIDFRCPQFGG
jgi:hypothetical protein